ncbi:hypothetical protein CLU79DRAFT_755255 [Phycomyces nitens]|nr:hypothetical protein CLU79DRAFT_755255 [Phycomyces nitens]
MCNMGAAILCVNSQSSRRTNLVNRGKLMLGLGLGLGILACISAEKIEAGGLYLQGNDFKGLLHKNSGKEEKKGWFSRDGNV